MYSYEEFLNTYQLPVRPKEFAIVFDAVPSGLIRLMQTFMISRSANSCTTDIFLKGKCIKDRTCTNLFIRELCKEHYTPRAKIVWNSKFQRINWKEVWNINRKFCVTNKIREVSYKIMHLIYPVNLIVKRFKSDVEVKCTFCGKEEESIEHLFYNCIYSRSFWFDIEHYLSKIIDYYLKLESKDVLLYYENCKLKRDQFF